VLELIFETHALTVDNERGIATGWNDGELSETGERLAAELGSRYRADPPAAVYASDLARAVRTAEIAFGGTDVPIVQDTRLRECDYGELNGAPVERIDAERLRCISTPFPGGQSYEQVVEQVRGFLADAAERWSGERIVVIGHSATRWALDLIVNGVPFETSVTSPFAWRPGWKYVIAK
jgi:alpha-ribazole phosphatase/probable phosphoglycerate mutase